MGSILAVAGTVPADTSLAVADMVRLVEVHMVPAGIDLAARTAAEEATRSTHRLRRAGRQPGQRRSGLGEVVVGSLEEDLGVRPKVHC